MNILIVEDDPQELLEVLPVCTPEDNVQSAPTCQEAIATLDEAWPEVIISDAIFPPAPTKYPDRFKRFMIGDLLDEVRNSVSKRNKKAPKVILISGAVEAAEHFSQIAGWLVDGRLYDVVPKGGFGSWAFFRAVLEHRLNSLRRDVRFAGVLQNAAESFREMARCGIITQDPVMLQRWQTVKRHALQDKQSDNLYISGEMGAGKDLFAQAVARLKDLDFLIKDPGYPLKESEYLPFNCNTNPSLFLSEMCGTKPGAFNDAKDKPGLIERAGNGVLFLDQFCSINDENQTQLLRLLEEDTREYMRSGGVEIKIAKCKFVIADTVSAKTASEAGANDKKRLIREMYGRLKHGIVEVPPLRDRRDDIPLLAKFFLDKFNPSHNKVTLEEEVIDRFYQGPWSGNVRALRDIVRDIVQVSVGSVGWAQVCEIITPDVLVPEVGDEPLRIKHGGRTDESVLKEEIRAHLNANGRALFEELQQSLQDPARKLDLDPYHVYSVLHYLCGDRSRKLRVSDGLTLLGVKDAQFTKIVRVLYESSVGSYKEYHRVTMLEEEKDGRALTYKLMSGLYI